MSERLVLGTAGLGGVWGKVDPDQSILTILSALEEGVTAIDTAPAYGDAEYYVGKALQQWKGKFPVISSKVGRLKSYAADQGIYDYTAEGMKKSVDDSLATLGIDQLDILFLHDPGAVQEEDAERIVTTLIKMREQGVAKRLGVGGNWPAWFKRYLDAGMFDVVMEFNRLNASEVAALHDSLPFCIANHIPYYAASPLNMGLLGKCIGSFKQMRPQWLSAEALQMALQLEQVAEKYQMSLPTLAHRFLLSLPYTFNIVLGPSNKIELDASISDFSQGPLPEEILHEIGSCNSGKQS
ncbi:aldo/keto reductase [Chitinophaga sp.]|uniref:aldo/keto reductase n=1 Tax=Chitinophaga sp. TaxID=1869181 RepID=UPI002F949E26